MHLMHDRHSNNACSKWHAVLSNEMPTNAGNVGNQVGRTTMLRAAIITGASGGIGGSIAKRLAKDGFAVVVNYAGKAAPAQSLVADIKAAGGQGIAVQADVAIAADVERLFKEAMEAFGRPDVVVHCAGIMPLFPIASGDVATFDKVIATNLRGTFLVFAQAAQHVQDGGRILAFSSSVLAKSFPTYGPTSLPRRELRGWFTCLPTNCVAGT